MVKIYGVSDDLIEIEGDIRQEIEAYEQVKHICLSDGLIVKINYDGEWNIKIVKKGDSPVKYTPSEGVDSKNYSDIIEINGNIGWAIVGDLFTK